MAALSGLSRVKGLINKMIRQQVNPFDLTPVKTGHFWREQPDPKTGDLVYQVVAEIRQRVE